MTKKTQSIIDETTDMNMKLYSPQPVILDRGEGCYAYDTDGHKCLDFAAGIAVASLGHAPPKLVKVISEQAGKIMACQSSYVTEAKFKASHLLLDNGGFDEVYFSNSGTESVELSLKIARKWSHENKGPKCTEIIAFRNSFHGRTYGSASVTEKRHTQAFFEPYLPDVLFADFNDIESVERKLSEKKTAGVIIEPVQGEGGLTPADPCFLRALRNLCDKNHVPLIFDEIQCGAGRLGTLYAHQSFECCDRNSCNHGENPDWDNMHTIEPDIVCLAKGIGSGFPVGAVLAKKKFAQTMVPGVHGTTYGGNPLACAVVACVIESILKPGVLDHVKAMSALLWDELHALKDSSNKINRIAGKGLMIGFETAAPVRDMIGALRKNGLMTTQAGADLVRMTPPLIIEEKHVKEAISIIDKTLKQDF